MGRLAKEIFHEALRREPAERDVFLDGSCHGDPHLRIEVESLLISLNEAETFLEKPVLLASSEREIHWQFSNDEVISHYRIIEPIGAGGMAEVYLAEDERLHRQVALKVLPSEVLQDVDRLRRFKREALAVSALNHPNILTIFEFDSVDGINLLASEYVRGKTLCETLRDGSLEVPDAIDIAVQVASALQTAHNAGVIHRDIKPENIMIRDDGYVKVLDFGLAKLTGEMRSRENDRTHTQAFSMPGLIMGTATYMSPEQARSKSIDSRTDIFSFGIVLYEMLAGRAPFSGETTTDIIAEIIQKEPSSASVHNSAVPDKLDRIINKCLEKDRNDRYQTASDLLVDLREVSRPAGSKDDRPDARVKSTDDQMSETQIMRSAADTIAPTSAKQYFVAAAVTSVLLILGIIAASYWYLGRDNQIESIAVLPFVNESGDTNFDYLSDGLTESVIDKLSHLPQLKVIARNSSFRYREQDPNNLQKVANELGVQAIVTGRVVQRGDNLSIRVVMTDARTNRNLWSDTYNRRAADALAVQEEIARTVSENLRLKLSGAQETQLAKQETENPEAYDLLLKGRFFWRKGGSENWKKATEYYNQAITIDPTYARAWAELSVAYGNLAHNSILDPKEFLPRAEVAALKASALDDRLADAHLAQANLKLNAWEWAAAEVEYKRAIELNPNFAEAYRWHAAYLTVMGRHEESIVAIKRSRELDPLSISVNADVGSNLHLARRYDEAIEAVKQALELDPNFPIAHVYLGYIYAAKGLYAESIASHQEAIRLGITGPSEEIFLGAAYARVGERKKAQEILKRLQTSKEYVSPGELAILYASLGELEPAFESLEKGFASHDLQLQYLGVDPAFDPLRSDPRFADLKRRVGLPE